jgi:hypothetical protein
LLREAAGYIECGEADKSVWRAVDAIGMVSMVLDAAQRGNVVGITMPTGRGYQLIKTEPPTVKVRKVK